jgi:hypothetical protein
MEGEGSRGRRLKQLLDDVKEKKILALEKGSNISYSVENSLWKRLWTGRKTDYVLKTNNSILKGFIDSLL